jgi:ParB family chromosome partitioning protein
MNGILQPITVRKTEKGYELVSGERRLRASRLAGLASVPCIVVDVNNMKSAVFALIENLQRQNLGFFEEARAIEKLMSEYGLSQEDASRRLGKAPSTVSNKLRLLSLNKEIRDILLKNNLTERHARALLSLKEELRLKALNLIVTKKLNVQETERLIKKLQQNKRGKQTAVIKDYKVFTNSFLSLVSNMRKNGIKAKTAKTETDEFIEYTIRIAKIPTTH